MQPPQAVNCVVFQIILQGSSLFSNEMNTTSDFVIVGCTTASHVRNKITLTASVSVKHYIDLWPPIDHICMKHSHRQVFDSENKSRK